jgi:hypothetical protein
MATLGELRARAQSFLEQPPAAAGRQMRGAAAPVGRGAEGRGTEVPRSTFSLFIPSQLKQAIDLAARFMEIANADGGDAGLEQVLDAADAAAREHDLELVKYALMVFVTHHPRGQLLPIPPLERRSPEAVLPSRGATRAALGPEAALDWFREDTWVNDHHSKWHIVYPGEGIPSAQNPQRRVLRSRQGELFYYMHQQMLARYDCERLSLGLAPTVPLADYTAPIPEGYIANLTGFSNRRPNDVMRDITFEDGSTYRVQDHAARRDRLVGAAAAGVLVRNGANVPIADLSQLGATSESTMGSIDGQEWLDPTSFYGSHHNFGHVLLSNLADPSGPNANQPGVMTSTATAMRDPIFYRWHRHVDDIFFTYQQRHAQPYDFADAPSGVVIRKSLAGWPAGDSPDILLCLWRDVPNGGAPGFDGRVFAQSTFGGGAWDQPRSAFPMLAAQLETHVRSQSIAMPNGQVIAKPYLDHEDFVYVFRAENQSAQDRPVTVRVFLAPLAQADNRRLWIEMDKFGVTLPASQPVTIFRSSRQSSVVRKPAWRPSEPRPASTGTTPDARNYCDCGWPYHLLLPRGSAAGVPFRLMVMMTDWLVDRVGADSTCGSLSFCGARDTDYPDARAMGYPFDRPVAGGLTIGQLLAHPTLQHVAATTVTIRLT